VILVIIISMIGRLKIKVKFFSQLVDWLEYKNIRKAYNWA